MACEREELRSALKDLDKRARNARGDISYVKRKKLALVRKIKFQEATIRKL